MGKKQKNSRGSKRRNHLDRFAPVIEAKYRNQAEQAIRDICDQIQGISAEQREILRIELLGIAKKINLNVRVHSKDVGSISLSKKVGDFTVEYIEKVYTSLTNIPDEALESCMDALVKSNIPLVQCLPSILYGIREKIQQLLAQEPAAQQMEYAATTVFDAQQNAIAIPEPQLPKEEPEPEVKPQPMVSIDPQVLANLEQELSISVEQELLMQDARTFFDVFKQHKEDAEKVIELCTALPSFSNLTDTLQAYRQDCLTHNESKHAVDQCMHTLTRFTQSIVFALREQLTIDSTSQNVQDTMDEEVVSELKALLLRAYLLKKTLIQSMAKLSEQSGINTDEYQGTQKLLLEYLSQSVFEGLVLAHLKQAYPALTQFPKNDRTTLRGRVKPRLECYLRLKDALIEASGATDFSKKSNLEQSIYLTATSVENVGRLDVYACELQENYPDECTPPTNAQSHTVSLPDTHVTVDMTSIDVVDEQWRNVINQQLHPGIGNSYSVCDRVPTPVEVVVHYNSGYPCISRHNILPLHALLGEGHPAYLGADHVVQSALPALRDVISATNLKDSMTDATYRMLREAHQPLRVIEKHDDNQDVCIIVLPNDIAEAPVLAKDSSNESMDWVDVDGVKKLGFLPTVSPEGYSLISYREQHDDSGDASQDVLLDQLFHKIRDCFAGEDNLYTLAGAEEVLEHASITLSPIRGGKHFHWKGPRGTTAVNSKEIRTNSIYRTHIIDLIAKIGNVDAFLAWAEKQTDQD